MRELQASTAADVAKDLGGFGEVLRGFANLPKGFGKGIGDLRKYSGDLANELEDLPKYLRDLPEHHGSHCRDVAPNSNGARRPLRSGRWVVHHFGLN